MDQEKLKKVIANNMLVYRKRAELTQAELAEKINYSDKAVSKWERGDGVPDVAVLCEMAELFGVTLNDMVSESAPRKIPPVKSTRIIIICLSVAIAWLVATLANVVLTIVVPTFAYSWLPYIYAIPVSFIILIVFTAVWKYNIALFVSVSGLIWTTLLSIFLTLMFIPNTAFMFLLGVPLEYMAVLWFFRPFRKKK